jgi:hypothetical protein
MKFNLNEDGSKFMRVIAWNKSGCVCSNGTMIGGETTATDIGNRRLRFLAYAQVSKDT